MIHALLERDVEVHRVNTPFDRIIATCSVPAVPWEWAEQLAPDGMILVDIKLATSAGNLVLLRRVDDRLEGRFTTRWAAFMAMRTGEAPEPVARADSAPGGETRPTDAPPTPWSDATMAWFLAHLRLTSFGYDLDPDTMQPVASTFATPDGSWARVNLADGMVTGAGDTPVWSHVEWAYEQWTTAGRPLWSAAKSAVAT